MPGSSSPNAEAGASEVSQALGAISLLERCSLHDQHGPLLTGLYSTQAPGDSRIHRCSLSNVNVNFAGRDRVVEINTLSSS